MVKIFELNPEFNNKALKIKCFEVKCSKELKKRMNGGRN